MAHPKSRFTTGRVGNFVLALMVVSILVLMIIPLPTFLLDLLLTLQLDLCPAVFLIAKGKAQVLVAYSDPDTAHALQLRFLPALFGLLPASLFGTRFGHFDQMHAAGVALL